MSGTTKHSVVLSIERTNMTRLSESVGCGLRIGKSLYGFRTVVCADTGGASFEFVNRYGERSTKKTCVVLYLMLQTKLSAA